MASDPLTSWQLDGEEMETVTDFIVLDFKITGDSDCSHEIKRRKAPWKKTYSTVICSQNGMGVVGRHVPEWVKV